jgi:hypothetical protein
VDVVYLIILEGDRMELNSKIKKIVGGMMAVTIAAGVLLVGTVEKKWADIMWPVDTAQVADIMWPVDSVLRG